MLKFTYTETGIDIERLAQSLEELVAGRVILAMRTGQRLCVEPSAASFLLPADLPGLHYLETEARLDGNKAIALYPADAEYVEVSLRGTWITSDPEGASGVLVTALSYKAEFFILKLWEEARNGVSLLKEVGE